MTAPLRGLINSELLFLLTSSSASDLPQNIPVATVRRTVGQKIQETIKAPQTRAPSSHIPHSLYLDTLNTSSTPAFYRNPIHSNQIPSMSKTPSSATGQALWSKMNKANAELFALTYGALVQELLGDFDTIDEIHLQLDKMGYSMGVRCVDEILAKSEQAGIVLPPCISLKDTAEVVAKTGFRMLLGMNVDITVKDESSFSLLFSDNPLALFVELPEEYKELQYSRVYCGILRGALEQVNLKVDCKFVKDMLQGDDVNEIFVHLKEVLLDGAGDDYKEE
jgi:trafficking protein particle complex subunit 3